MASCTGTVPKEIVIAQKTFSLQKRYTELALYKADLKFKAIGRWEAYIFPNGKRLRKVAYFTASIGDVSLS